MQPELWEATTAYIRNLPAYVQMEKTTAVPLRLEPYESVFIVFRNKAGMTSSAEGEVNYPAPFLLAELKGPWTVQFDAAMRGPERPVVFETIGDWTTHTDEQIKYYSGTAVYQMVFSFKDKPSDQRIFIDLGDLTAMAKVTLNGKYAGGVWTKPYRLDITEWVKQGENDLKVEVVNTWLNRLIGDSQLPAGKRPTWCPVNPYKPGDPLQPSGLFGPVFIVSYNYR